MNDDYRLSHRAPGPEEDGTTVRLDQVGGEHDEVFPADVDRHPERYGAEHAETVEQVRQAHGDPDAMVQVWRAVPAGVEVVNPGDWVGLSPQKAQAEAAMEHSRVITATATARDLWCEGVLEEWGYQGAAPLPVRAAGLDRSVVRASYPHSAMRGPAARSAAVATVRAETEGCRRGRPAQGIVR
ncbi:hypothetical protein [Propionibacterium sp.]|uniref:hypothetical protein n=1 Tax=Propionibacterium sp. TaxID=1977903 RepID=UPI0039E8B8A8